MTELLSARGVDKAFTGNHGPVEALAHVDLAVGRDEFVSIVGPSGCGKTTLLRLLGGLQRPSRGTVRYDGEPVRGARRDFGFVFQQPHLLPWRTVIRNTMLPLKTLRLNRGEDGRRRAAALLELVGLAGFEDAYPRELSGGMQQRAAITRALVYDPAVLLMDEPFGAVDAITREQMNHELLRIWSEVGKTIVFITHSISEAVFLSDRVLVMTARPGSITSEVAIDLPRPRTAGMELTQEFMNLAQQVRHALDHRSAKPSDGAK